MNTKEMMRLMHGQINDEKRGLFFSLGSGGRYTEKQKRFAFELINEHGMRATARILRIPRRTLQRWCRKYGIYVSRCPSWVRDWAERRREKTQVLEKQRIWIERSMSPLKKGEVLRNHKVLMDPVFRGHSKLPSRESFPAQLAIVSPLHIHYFASSLSTSAMSTSGSAVLSR